MVRILLSLSMVAALVIGCGGGAEEAAAPSPSSKSAPAAKAPSAGPAGALNGMVTFDGEAPSASPIQMAADPSCARMHPDAAMTEFVVVGEGGGLKNVFVYVKEGLEGQTFDVPTEAATLSQEGCLYTPHVFGVRAGQTLTIMNGDDTLHNIHAMPKNNKEFNIGQPVKGLKTDKVFENPEVMVPFKCDVHKWMASYVGVVDHPFFATTDANGSYSIPGLPPGDYVVEAWHEKYGTQQMNVTVGADGGDVSFTFSE
jgi:plastocyanin